MTKSRKRKSIDNFNIKRACSLESGLLLLKWFYLLTDITKLPKLHLILSIVDIDHVGDVFNYVVYI